VDTLPPFCGTCGALDPWSKPMKKPHEEEWEADGAGVYEVQSQDIVGGGSDDHRHTEASPPRARLAAQAPAMARLLLRLQWSGRNQCDEPQCPSCHGAEWQHGWPQTGHEEHCELAAVLRAAGVRP